MQAFEKGDAHDKMLYSWRYKETAQSQESFRERRDAQEIKAERYSH